MRFKTATKATKAPKDLLNKKKSVVSKLLDNLVGEKKELSKYWKVVKQIEDFEPKISLLSDEELKLKTLEFRKRLVGFKDEKLEEKLKEILPEAFAVVREASHRAIGMKHYPVQMIGGMVLNEGRIAEMKTGEGKTLVATLAVYLNALPEQNQVHVVTVNDYLARRDASWMGKIYDFLGLKVGIIQNQASFYFKLGEGASEQDKLRRKAGLLEDLEDGEHEDSKTVLDVENLVPCERKRAYWDDLTNTVVDVVYGVNSEFGFDYLRDNMAQTKDAVSQKNGHTVAIVDEVDSILIDEARTPLIISSQGDDSSEKYNRFASLVTKLNPDLDYDVDEKRKVVTLTSLGLEKVERMLGVNNLYESSENVGLIHHLDQALKAKALFRNNKEYVVKDNEILIVDENTGRMMFGRRFNQGLHQAIEAKEGVEIKSESKTSASVTFQNFFRLYKKLSGMTGTAETEAEELFKIYKLLVVSIPTNKPSQRVDKIDQMFKTERGKFMAVVRDIKEAHEKGQPVLVGTTSIERNAMLAEMLKQAGVPFQLLNAKNHEKEAKIISEAGKKGSVTIATNIAGRGVDIKLGGEPPEKDATQVEWDRWEKEHQEVKNLGGLFVIGTERHESRRIDNQLRGRAGRQGDPGMSRFYISLQDYILRVFGGDRVSYYNILPIPEDQAIENGLLNKLVEQAQKKIEGQNYDIRKHVTDYDDVVNRQRKVIYERRRKVLFNDGFDYKSEITKTFERRVHVLISGIEFEKVKKPNLDSLNKVAKGLKEIANIAELSVEGLELLLKSNKYKIKLVESKVLEIISSYLNQKWEIYNEKAKEGISRYVFLRAIDILWIEQLVSIDHLNDSVRFRGYSQKDPLTEFKHDGMALFESLLNEIDAEIARTVLKVTPNLVPQEMV